MRTNCLDCLDRTNLVQSAFAMKSLMMQFHMFNILEIDNFGVIERGFKEGACSSLLETSSAMTAATTERTY